MVKNVLVVIIFSMLIFSCAKVGFREDWDLKLNNVEKGKLKLNGYFFTGDSEYLYAPMFIYTNGIVCRIMNDFEAKTDSSSFLVFESLLTKPNFINGFNDEEPYWGIVETYNLKILWQKRKYDFNYGTYRHADVFEGEILNDTTFVFREKYRLKRGRKKDIEKLKTPIIYKFRNFSIKPDSINPFVK